METNTVMTVFVAVAALAFLAQALILLMIAIQAKKTQERVLTIVEELQGQVRPVLSSTRELLDDSLPKVKSITANLAETSYVIRSQAIELNEAMDDVVGRARRQAVRVDGLVTQTLDSVESTRNKVEHGVSQMVDRPVRMANGIVNGVKAAIETLLKRRQASAARAEAPEAASARRPRTDFSVDRDVEEVFD
jgi:uncharacterized protein YoxC